MRKIVVPLLVCLSCAAQAQTGHVVISEVYGGGGNSGAQYKNDFIELYNPTGSAVSLAGWSVQYASAGGSFTQVTSLSGTIAAHGFYLIQEAQGAGGTLNLPTPDATGTIAMAGASGKVALLNSTVALGATCSGTAVVDLVAYGTGISCSEGSAPAPLLSNTTSAERKASSASTAATMGSGGSEQFSGNGYDTDVNSADFVAQTAITPQNTGAGTESAGTLTVTAAAGTAPAEPATNGTFTLTLSSAAPAGGVTVTYTLSGTAAGGGVDYTDASAGSVTIAQGNSTATVTLTTVDDAIAETSETVILTLAGATAGYSVSPATATITFSDDDAAPTLISTIQGSGATATSGLFTAEGIVTGVFPGLSPAGFYLQEEDADADADPATAEGIFVVSGSTVSVGDKVRVTGTVQESSASPSFGQAVFTTGTSVAILGNTQPTPAATVIALPVTSLTDVERYEGMLVRFADTLTVTNNFTLGRYGEVGLSAGGAVYQPTQLADPNDAIPSGTSSTGSSNVAAVSALAAANALRTILLDDGTNTTTVLPYAGPDSTLRLGSTIGGLTGIMGYAFDAYRIQPVPYAYPEFSYAPRPSVPTYGTSANVKLASFNVLNYFNGDGSGGGFPTARGAHSLAEFNRQRAKTISAISEINADVVGLIEMENDGTGAGSAIRDLVDGLNTAMGPGTYSFIDDGASIQNFGSDAIRCAIIYKPAVVTPAGAVMIGPDAVFNRPPVAQTFTLQASGEKFNFIINHFKSKGCTGASGSNADAGDGQSCYNDLRRQQAAALITFVNGTVISQSGTDRVVSVGDYNAYYEEDPLDVLRASGFTTLSTSASYSYQFDGQIGSLDHAVVTGSALSAVTAIAKWNINAAEPVYLDYNDAVNDGNGDVVNPFAYTYTANAFRSSDHDPVLIGLNLATVLPLRLALFEAKRVGNTASLRWISETKEVGTFLLERFEGAEGWRTLHRVNASAAGRFAVTDAQPRGGDNLYRLHWVEQDGSESYSETRSLHFGEAAQGLEVYPNPAEDVLFLRHRGAMLKVEVRNSLNEVVLRNGSVSEALDVSGLKPGLYFLHAVFSDGEGETLRFTKR